MPTDDTTRTGCIRISRHAHGVDLDVEIDLVKHLGEIGSQKLMEEFHRREREGEELPIHIVGDATAEALLETIAYQVRYQDRDLQEVVDSAMRRYGVDWTVSPLGETA